MCLVEALSEVDPPSIARIIARIDVTRIIAVHGAEEGHGSIEAVLDLTRGAP